MGNWYEQKNPTTERDQFIPKKNTNPTHKKTIIRNGGHPLFLFEPNGAPHFWGRVFQRRFGSCTEDLRRFTGSGGLLSPRQAWVEGGTELQFLPPDTWGDFVRFTGVSYSPEKIKSQPLKMDGLVGRWNGPFWDGPFLGDVLFFGWSTPGFFRSAHPRLKRLVGEPSQGLRGSWWRFLVGSF